MLGFRIPVFECEADVLVLKDRELSDVIRSTEIASAATALTCEEVQNQSMSARPDWADQLSDLQEGAVAASTPGAVAKGGRWFTAAAKPKCLVVNGNLHASTGSSQ